MVPLRFAKLLGDCRMACGGSVPAAQFKGGARPRFPLEAFQGLLAGGELFGKKLQGDLTTQGQFLQP